MSEANVSEPGPAEATALEAPVTKFKKKKKRGATRKTKALVEESGDALGLEGNDDDDIRCGHSPTFLSARLADRASLVLVRTRPLTLPPCGNAAQFSPRRKRSNNFGNGQTGSGQSPQRRGRQVGLSADR